MNYTDLLALATQVKEETNPEVNTALRIGTLFEEIIKYLRDMSGWASYQDTQYTEANPFLITTSDGLVDLPNNAGITIEAQKPPFLNTFYDSDLNAILGVNGMGLGVVVEYKVKPTTSASNVRVNNLIDIGGSVGAIYPRDFVLSKGAVEHNYLSSVASYTLDTWEANGGIPKIQTFNSNVEVYDIRFVLTLLHKPIV